MVARIDPTDYETAVRTLEGQLGRGQAIAKRARADVVRNENIRKQDPGAISQAAIDRSREALDAASASVRSLRASVKTASDRLGYTELKAPFDGFLVEADAAVGKQLGVGDRVARLIDADRLEAPLHLSAADFSRVPPAGGSPGPPARVVWHVAGRAFTRDACAAQGPERVAAAW